MNVNWNAAASAAQWGNYQNVNNRKAETTGTLANNQNDPIFKQRNAETAGAIAMFGGMNGSQQQGRFMAMA